MSSNINLISPKKEAHFSKYYKGIHVLRLVAVTLLFGVSTSAVVLFMLIALSPLPQLKQQEQSERAILAQAHTEMAKIQIIHNRTQLINSVLAERTSYSTVIASIRSKMVNGLTLSSFTINGKNMTLSVSSRSLAAVETFLKNLTNAAGAGEYSKVTLTTIIQDNEKGAYVTTVQVTLQ